MHTLLKVFFFCLFYQTWYCSVLHKQSLVCSCFSFIGCAPKAVMAGDQKTAWHWWEVYHPAKCRKCRASVWYGNCWPAVKCGQKLRHLALNWCKFGEGSWVGQRRFISLLFNTQCLHIRLVTLPYTLTHSLSQKHMTYESFNNGTVAVGTFYVTWESYMIFLHSWPCQHTHKHT